jgi:hypothetical protein
MLKFFGNVLAVFGLALLFADLVLAPMEKTFIVCSFMHGCQ